MTWFDKSKLPAWILAGAALGLIAGVTFGDRMAPLQSVGVAYAKLLEIAVFPYLVCSLFVGLGGLARERAGRLLRASWAIYLVLWGLTFLSIFLIGGFIPAPHEPTLLLPEEAQNASSFLDLLIPANIGVAIDRNFVPAVVVFAALYAIAIQTIPQKASFLEVMETLRKASVTIWNWVVYVAPIGVFALFASTAGTVDPVAAGSMLVYTALFLFGTLVLGFVILPWLLSRFVPHSYGALLAELRPALTLALVTTLSVSALPFIQRAVEEMCRREGVEGEEAGDVIKASLSIAYVLSQLGNYFVALFLIFASYHQRVSIAFWDMVLLPVMTLLSGIGSPSASVDAVAFLSQWLKLPAQTTSLYVETMTITRYGQVALSVIGFAFVTYAVTMNYFGRATIRLRHILTASAMTVVIFGAVALGGRAFAERLFPPPSYASIMARSLEPELTREVNAVVHRTRPADLTTLPGAATLEGIRARGRIRVGYGSNILPFSYFNASGDLVGYDVEAAYRFARSLHLGIEFVPVEWSTLEDDLKAGRFDIVMAGAYATPERIRSLAVSAFYLVEPLAFIVPARDAGAFQSYQEIVDRPGLRLAVFHDPVLQPLVQSLFPKAEVVLVGTYDELVGRKDIHAALWTRDQAAAWTSAHLGYTAVVPRHIGAPLPLAYLLPPGGSDMLRYLNLWLELQHTSGARAASRAYWIAGTAREAHARRWNLLDDVINARR